MKEQTGGANEQNREAGENGTEDPEKGEYSVLSAERMRTLLNRQMGFVVIGPDDQVPPEFAGVDGKVYCFNTKTRSYYAISDTLFYPGRVYFNEDTEEETVEIIYHAHGRWRSFSCSRRDLEDKKFLKGFKDYGIEIDTDYLDEVRRFLNETIRDYKGTKIRIIRTTDHLGWYAGAEGEPPEFVPYSERIHYSGKRFSGKKVKSLLTPSGALEDWVDLMNSFRDSDHVEARLVLAAGFASVLVKILGAQTFAVDIWGPESGSGKSVALSTAVSVWAKPGIEEGYIRKADSTGLSLETYASIYHHLPLGIDETSTESSRRKLGKFVYNICSEISHGALNANGTLREQQNWANCVILTGEMPITSEQSLAGTVNRVIEIEAPAHVFWDDGPRMMHYIGQLRENYGTAGREFVTRLMEKENADYARGLFRQYYEEMYRVAAGKQAESAAVLLTADRLAAEWIFGDDVILTVEDISPFVKSDREVNTNERVHQLILEWIALNSSKFEEGKDIRWGRFGIRDGRRTIEIVRKTFNDFLRREGFSDRSYLSWARRTGKLYFDPEDPERRNDVRGKLNGRNVRFVCIFDEEKK